jgi:hypothetical protein
VQLRRQVIDEKIEDLMDRRVRNHMIIVEDQDAAVGVRQERVDQARQQGQRGRRLWRAEQRQAGGSQAGHPAVQRGDQIVHEAGGLRVGRIECQPSHAAPGLCLGVQPLGQQRAFAEAGGRRKQGESAAQARIEALGEPGPRNQPWAGRRQEQLGGDEIGRQCAHAVAAPGGSRLVGR